MLEKIISLFRAEVSSQHVKTWMGRILTNFKIVLQEGKKYNRCFHCSCDIFFFKQKKDLQQMW